VVSSTHTFCVGAHCTFTDLTSAAEEAREVLCCAMAGLLAKTGLRPSDVDVLVTTCSIFCPTPSMASMVVNHFKMRPDVQVCDWCTKEGGGGCAWR
jgi:3-ketoacyl-CoA synthase